MEHITEDRTPVPVFVRMRNEILEHLDGVGARLLRVEKQLDRIEKLLTQTPVDNPETPS